MFSKIVEKYNQSKQMMDRWIKIEVANSKYFLFQGKEVAMI